MDDDAAVDPALSPPRASDAEDSKRPVEKANDVLPPLTPEGPGAKHGCQASTRARKRKTATAHLREERREEKKKTSNRSQTPQKRSSSPVSGALRQYLASRLAAADEDLYPVRIPPDLLSPPKKDSSSEIAPSAGKLKKQEASRKVLYRGEDEVIIEICKRTEESPVAAALVRALDNAKKQNISFCCHANSNTPQVGRKCVSFLQKEKKKSKTETSTHTIIPYQLILLEASEFMEELGKDKLQTLLRRVSTRYPDSKVGLVIIGLEVYLRLKKGISVPYSMAQVDSMMVDIFVKFTGIVYCMVASMTQTAEYIIELSRAFLRMMKNDYDVSFLTAFGGCKMTEAIKTVELNISAEAPGESREEMLAWISLLTAIPGIGPKDAHGIALVYPSFSALMDAYASTSRSEDEKKLLVADVKLPPQNKQRIGDAASTSLYKFLCNADPEEDVDGWTLS